MITPDIAAVETALDVLIERFDSVQVFATRHEPTEGGTVRIEIGRGNLYARVGQIREWLIREDAAADEAGRAGWRENEKE